MTDEITVTWATDIHLDHVAGDGISALARSLSADHPRAVVLTGDLSIATRLSADLRALCEGIAAPVYFVLGNHDFYRGSVAEVRRWAEAFAVARYLPSAGVVTLAPGVALVGVDGWGDARDGNVASTPVMLNDFRFIDEERDAFYRGREALVEFLRAAGDVEAGRLRALLDEAVRSHRRVVVATHVPPFSEACWYDGKAGAPDWTPYFACRAAGDVLREVAERHPAVEFTVLCGHTHGSGEFRAAPNLVVHTGAAEYGEPRAQNVLRLSAQ